MLVAAKQGQGVLSHKGCDPRTLPLELVADLGVRFGCSFVYRQHSAIRDDFREPSLVTPTATRVPDAKLVLTQYDCGDCDLGGLFEKRLQTSVAISHSGKPVRVQDHCQSSGSSRLNSFSIILLMRAVSLRRLLSLPNVFSQGLLSLPLERND
jgi:hypothetical protein